MNYGAVLSSRLGLKPEDLIPLKKEHFRRLWLRHQRFSFFWGRISSFFGAYDGSNKIAGTWQLVRLISLIREDIAPPHMRRTQWKEVVEEAERRVQFPVHLLTAQSVASAVGRGEVDRWVRGWRNAMLRADIITWEEVYEANFVWERPKGVGFGTWRKLRRYAQKIV